MPTSSKLHVHGVFFAPDDAQKLKPLFNPTPKASDISTLMLIIGRHPDVSENCPAEELLPSLAMGRGVVQRRPLELPILPLSSLLQFWMRQAGQSTIRNQPFHVNRAAVVCKLVVNNGALKDRRTPTSPDSVTFPNWRIAQSQQGTDPLALVSQPHSLSR